MKRFLLALALLLLPSVAAAQCNGVFAPNTVCGTVAGGIPGQVSNSVFTGVPGGTNGQIQYNAAGVFGGFTQSGDCTTTTSTGVTICTKTNNVAFVPSATTDTTNATNIASGTLAAARLPSGVSANVLNTQTANYTIANTDCGKNVQAGTGSTGNFTITLPAVGGFATNCSVLITNGDTARGKKLSGFPADMAATWGNLGPLQSVGVQIVNGAWATYYNPGRWQTSGETFFVDPSAGSDLNDGLAAGSGNAFLTIGHAINVFYASVSHNYGPVPTINVLSGSTVTESLVITGQPVGVDGVLIQGNGGAFTWNASSTFCVEVGDMAIVQFNNVTFACGSGAQTHFAVFGHNQAVVDLGTGITFGNQGSNGDDIHCDFQTQINLNNSYTITGTKANHINMISHCATSYSSITVTASATPTIGVFIKAYGGSYMNAFSATYSGAYTAGMKQWDVQGNSVLLNDGTTIPGSVAGTSGTGGQVCANC